MTDLRKTAVYIRLSAEDDNVDGRAKKESDSVTSQRILLKSFVIDELGVAESDILEYVDDGVSGTHFKRQGFQQLQDDMKSGEIGCVVVKDFSRFGRDYLEVGFYIEYIFPLLQIRFISINDSYDSAASSGMTGGMNVALQNLVYNMYSLDLSKKISSAMQTRTKNGTRLPVNARYGYKKGKDGRLEVDPEAAKVVKMIFRMHFICFFKQLPVYNCRMVIFQTNPFCFIIQNCFMASMHTATCFSPDSGSNINLIPDNCRYCRRAPVFLFDRVKPLELHLIPS